MRKLTLEILESIAIILHENLGMPKLLSKRVQRLLTPNQNQQHVDNSERCLVLFKRDKKDFLQSMKNGFTTTYLN